MRAFFSDLHLGLRDDFTGLHINQLRLQLALKAATAATMACLLSFFLQIEQPYWAGVSAFVVTQSTVGGTVYKSLMRICGTLAGALLGLLVAALLAQEHVLFMLAVGVISIAGIYLTAVLYRHTYAWTFVYVTALMVMMGGLSNPQAANFEHLAFYRSLEITIGILVGMLVNLLLFRQLAQQRMASALSTARDALVALGKAYFDTLSAADNASKCTAFEHAARQASDALRKLDQLVDYASHEAGIFQRTNSQRDMALSLHRMAETFFFAYREQQALNIATLSAPDLSTLLQRASTLVMQLLRSFPVDVADANTRVDTASAALQEKLSRQLLELDARIKQHPQAAAALLVIYESLSFLAQELRHCGHNTVTAHRTAADSDVRSATGLLLSGLYFDRYVLRYATAAGVAILIVPFFWLYMNWPGYSQIVISLIVCFTLHKQVGQAKGYLRLAGCVIGFFLTLMVLWLDIQNVAVLSLLLFGLSLGCGLVYFGDPRIAYCGVQALLVILVGLVGDLYPTQSLIHPLERVAGIFLGVLSLLLLNRLLVDDSQHARLRQQMRRVNHAFSELLLWLFQENGCTISRLQHWKNRHRFAHCLNALREFQDTLQAPKAESQALQQLLLAQYGGLMHSCYMYVIATGSLMASAPSATEQHYRRLARRCVAAGIARRETMQPDEWLACAEEANEAMQDIVGHTDAQGRGIDFATLTLIRRLVEVQRLTEWLATDIAGPGFAAPDHPWPPVTMALR